MKLATCHPQFPVHARGLCHACYAKACDLKLLGGFPPRRATSKRAEYWREYKRRKTAERRAA